VTSSTSAVFDDAWRMTGIDRFMMDLVLNPDFVRMLLRKVCDYWLKYARLILENAEGRIDLMWTSDDLGTQNGPFISREMAREFIMPHIRERADLFKSFGARVAMHSCGGIYPLIPDIIECGVEVLNPIQPAARGMDRRKIKAAFGNRLVFHGSVDQQKTMVFGTPGDVARETRECMETLGAGGGYIVASSHALETDIPTENVLALYETALRS
jgi:uroporphyrinogen decarboxylase